MPTIFEDALEKAKKEESIKEHEKDGSIDKDKLDDTIGRLLRKKPEPTPESPNSHSKSNLH